MTTGRLHRLIGVLCLLWLTPALAASPEAGRLYEAGIAARKAGEPAKAVKLFEQSKKLDPKNTDTLLMLGLLYLQQDKVDLAIAQLEAAHALAPAYSDVSVALARGYLRKGRPSQAEALLDEVLKRDPEHKDALELRRSFRKSQTLDHPWTLSASGEVSTFRKPGPSNWHEEVFEATGRLTEQTTMAMRGVAAQRYGQHDETLEASIAHRLTPALSAYAAFAATPDAQFREDWALRGGTAIQLHRGMGSEGEKWLGASSLLLDAHHRSYPALTTTTYATGLEQYLLNDRVSITARALHQFTNGEAYKLGWQVRGDLYASDLWGLYLLAARASESDLGVFTTVKTLGAGVVWRPAPLWQVRVGTYQERRVGSWTRLATSVGLAVQF